MKMRVVVIPRRVIEEIEAMEPPEERHVLEAKCPFCGGIGARFNFRFHLESGVDFDVVTCRHCKNALLESPGVQISISVQRKSQIPRYSASYQRLIHRLFALT
ncbi:MAG: hypothetical protein MPW15_16780 [Candidatus Manganitrophus sp.]|nr:hypothetical protein [Candidatus Manganitrophus sp.]